MLPKSDSLFLQYKKVKWANRYTRLALFFISLSSLSALVLIFASLAFEAGLFFNEISIWEFLTDKEWTPLFEKSRFGIWPLLSGTLTITFTALILASPIGLALGIFFSEYTTPQQRNILKPIIELLSGIPTLVLGYVGLFYLTPLIQKAIPSVPPFNKLSASIMLGVLLVPYITTLIEDALSQVPKELREASLALGSSRIEGALRVLVPAAMSGVLSAILLATARAMGETMIVTIAAGSMAQLSWNLLEGGQTLTAFIAAISLGDSPHGSVNYQSMFAVGFVLFVATLSLNSLSLLLRKKS